MRVYLDNAATTPVSRAVLDAMLPHYGAAFGNPSSLHSLGVEAGRAIEAARRAVAAACPGASWRVAFTSGGTEANAIAVQGAAPRGKRKHVVVGAIEHASVLDAARDLATRGCEVTEVACDPDGIVPASAVLDAVRDDTALVAIMHANNEIGTVQPIAEIARGLAARDARAHFHVDAVQSAAWLALDDLAGATSIAMSAHKFHGPKGTGALLVREGASLRALVHGGGQEGGLRPGTQNVAGIAGLAAALAEANAARALVGARVRELRDALAERVLQSVERAYVVGSRERRLPGNVCFAIPGVRSETLLHALEERGVLASAGSACHARDDAHTHVFRALNVPPAHGVVRLSLSRDTTAAEIDHAAGALAEAVAVVRR